MMPPQQPQPFPGQPPPGAPSLVLELRRPFGAMGLMSPVVTIDGYPAAAVWGTNVYPAPPGRRHVRIATRYLWEFGAAETDVDVFPGQTAVVHYTGPLVTFMSGRVGPTEQPRPGMALYWTILGVVLLILVLSIVVGALGS